MLRKTVLAIAATAALGVAALAPTAASAGYKSYGHNFRHYNPSFNYVYGGCYWRWQWVYNDYGYLVRRKIRHCY